MRTYSEQEVADIIERAVERQRAAERDADGPGLTIDEIERLGRDAGIDPAYLRQAAAEVDAVGRTLARQSGHTKTHVFVERWVDTPFTPTGWEDVVSHLQATVGPELGAMMGQPSSGTVQQIGQAYEWSHTSALGVQTRVTVSPRGDRTRLRMTQLVGLSSPTVEGVGYGGGIAVLIALFTALATVATLDSAGLAAIAALCVFVLSWAAAAPLVAAQDRRWRDKKLRQLDALADDLVPLLGSQGALTSMPDAKVDAPEHLAPEPAGRLDLAALDTLVDEGDQSPGVRRRTRG